MGKLGRFWLEIDKMLALCGIDKSKAVSVSTWVMEIRSRDGMNEERIAWTGGQNLPARACVEARLASPAMLVEIAVTATK